MAGQDVATVGVQGCEAALCRITVKPAKNKDHSKKFFDRLNTDFEAFSYGVTPKNLRQRLAFGGTAARNMAAMLRSPALGASELTGLAKAIHNEAETLRSIVGQPIVVGFGRGKSMYQDSKSRKPRAGTQLDGLSSETEFGWIIAPERRWREGGSGTWHPHQQHALSAVISVPSWWRRAELEIFTCWRTPNDLKNLGDGYISECGEKLSKRGGRGNFHTYDIKLPGDIKEVSRKLRIDVRDVPYVLHKMHYEDASQNYTIRVGRKADIVIHGSRLWRSTRVTLGTQPADEIVVLPNMEGIIATFTCVHRPLQWPVDFQRIGDEQYSVFDSRLRVWTSEGVTHPLPANIIESTTSKPDLCPDEVLPRIRQIQALKK